MTDCWGVSAAPPAPRMLPRTTTKPTSTIAAATTATANTTSGAFHRPRRHPRPVCPVRIRSDLSAARGALEDGGPDASTGQLMEKWQRLLDQLSEPARTG